MLKPLKLPSEHPIAAERDVGVREAQPGGDRSRAAASCARRLGGGRLGLLRSGLVGSPAGALGSKKPGGFGSVATSSMFRAASPAFFKPGLRPTRGSVAVPAGLSCAAR